jgi:hypothetical protein
VAVISEEHGYLFILTPGTGSTATAGVLCAGAGGRWLPAQDVYDEAGGLVAPWKHTTIAQLRRLGPGHPDLRRLHKFSTVRNPFDYWASQWVRLRLRWPALLAGTPDPAIAPAAGDPPGGDTHEVILFPGDEALVRDAAELDFPEWLARRLRPRAERGETGYLHPAHLRGLDGVLRFERLQEDFDAVLARLGLEPLEIPRRNVTPQRHPDYRTYYDPATRGLVEQVFAPFLRDFGYSF